MGNKTKIYDGTTFIDIDADTLDGKHASEFSSKEETSKLTNYTNVLQMLVEGSTINQEVEDNTKSYIKDVPYKSSSIAKIKEIGGMCYKINQLVTDDKHFKTITLTEETSEGFVRPLDNFIYSNNMTYLLGHKTLGLLKTSNNNLIVKNGAKGRPIIGINEVTDAYFYNSNFSVYVYANSTIGAGTYTMDFMLVDLTTIYGKGKEPTTVAQFLEDYPMFNDYVPYNEGEVTETKVTSIDCVGANIWDEEWELGAYNETNGQTIANNNCIRSKANNYIRVLSNTDYYFFIKNYTNQWLRVMFYDDNKNFIGESGAFFFNKIKTTPINCSYIRFYLTAGYGTTYNNDIAIIKGTSGTYTPYRHKNYPINESIQSLDGYGLGLNSNLYNYIDFENKKFIKKVARVDLGTLGFNYSTQQGCWLSNNILTLAKRTPNNYTNPKMIAEKYAITNVGNIYGQAETAINKMTINTNGYLLINNGSTTTPPSGMLYYELATYEEVDLKDIIKDDAFIEVESKGTITFENEKQYAVPNNVMFFIKEEDSKPLIPTKTSQLENDSGYLAKDSDISVKSVTATGDIKSSTGKVSGVVVEGETVKENGKDISQVYLGINSNAVSATKATQDGSGNVITSTYETKNEVVALLSSEGWYRVAKYNGNAWGSYTNSCELIIKRVYENGNNEYHKIQLLSTYNNQSFKSIDKSNAQLFTKIRYAINTSTKIAYLEVYYNANTNNPVYFKVNNGRDFAYNWSAINPIATSETVDGVTISATYDIPANANPVNSLDIPTKVSDLTNDSGYLDKTGTIDKSNKLVSSNNRPTSANFGHGDNYVLNYASMRLDVVGSSMTVGKPSNNGYLCTLFWDDGDAYDTQLYIPFRSDVANLRPQIRSRNARSSWQNDWISIPYMSDIPTKTSQLTNDSNYIAGNVVSNISSQYNEQDIPTAKFVEDYVADKVPSKTTTTIFNTLTSLNTNATAVGVFTSKSITLTDSVQVGDRLKVYLRGNSGYEQYCAGIIEFELYAPTSSKLVGSGMIMPTIGDQKFIVSASITSTTSTTTSLSIVAYTLSARSGNTPAGANNVNVLKVERIR